MTIVASGSIGTAPRHVLRSQQFTRTLLEGYLFPEARRMRSLMRESDGEDLRRELRHRSMVTLFYEPSTRTRLSFELAATHLGMHVRGTENASEFSSAIKGETVEDSLRVISSYHPDVIILRHKETGIVERAAPESSVPVINAGDGTGQHPSQALLDVFTIFDEKDSIDGLTVVFGGDLRHGRTVRSLAYLLSKFDDVKLIFVSPEQFRIGDDIKDHLRERGVKFEETEDVQQALTTADVVYWTRVQKERMGPEMIQRAEAIQEQFTIKYRMMSWMKRDAILMHPLPRVSEIRPEIDHDPRAAYFRQAQNGLYVRMALLKWVISGD